MRLEKLVFIIIIVDKGLYFSCIHFGFTHVHRCVFSTVYLYFFLSSLWKAYN